MKHFIFLFLFFGILLPFRPLWAIDTPHGITVDPAFQEIVIDKETNTKDFSVSLRNTTESSVILRIQTLDFGSLDESGGIAFLGATSDLTRQYAIASWVRPEKDVIILEPNESKSIRITIENRESLSAGGHYGALTFQTEEKSLQNDTEIKDVIAINQLFSTLLFVKKIGGEIYHLELKESKYENSPLFFQNILRIRFQNSGNIHLVPRGVVSIMDPLKRVVAQGVLNEESSIILPETFRVYPIQIRTLAPLFVPGMYTLDVSYRYDGKEDFSYDKQQFFFIPLSNILAILSMILLFFGRKIYRLKKRKSESAL